MNAEDIADDGGAEDPPKVAERRCLLTREVLPKEALLRFVIGPDGMLVADYAAKLPGRGASIKPDRSLIESAMKNGKLAGLMSRALKHQVTADQVTPDHLTDWTDALLKRCAARLGQAQRSGDCVTGFDKIKAALGKGFEPGLLLVADDAGDDGVKKMGHVIDPSVGRDHSLTRATLSTALGVGNAVHVLIRQGRNADLLVSELKRYQGLKGSDAE